jgi:amino acid transporter
MSMSRDGLLPKAFSRIHPKYKTPSFSTIVTGFVVAVPALFLNLTEVTDLTSIGTLFAFVLVCGGVLLLPVREAGEGKPKFKIPYINSQLIVPVLFLIGVTIFWKNFLGLFDFTEGWDVFRDKLPFFLFVILAVALTLASFVKKLSLIPVLGLASCFYLMTELGYTNWLRFLIWLVIGLIIYFLYSRHSSELAKEDIV